MCGISAGCYDGDSGGALHGLRWATAHPEKLKN